MNTTTRILSALSALSALVALVVGVPAHAFVFDDPPARRAQGEYVFNTQINHSTLGATDPGGTSWNDGFVEALDAWNDAAGLGTLVGLSANVGVFEDPCEVSNDGVHGVDFTADVCGVVWGGTTVAIALKSFFTGGLVTDGNIVFRDDGTIDWDIVSGNQGAATDFRRVAVHEVGHLLGLNHPPGSNAIMFAMVQDGVEVPQADDIAGIEALYGQNCPVVTDAGSGTIDESLGALDCLDSDIGLPAPSLGSCSGFIFGSDTFVDLYQVSLPSGTNLDAELSSQEFNPSVQILNTALTSELGCAASFSGTASLSLALPEGDYIVATRSIGTAQGIDYTLMLTPEPTGPLGIGAVLLALATRRRR